METRFRRKNGEIGLMLLSAKIIEIQGEKCLLSITRDITAIKQAEADLRESERTLSTLMGNLPGMAYRCKNDRERTMQFVSQGCLDLTGYSPEDLINNLTVSYGALIPPPDRKKVWKVIQKAIHEKCSFQNQYRIITSHGEEKWVLEQGLGVFSEKGELVAIEGFVSDITERKRMEERLQYLINHDALTGLYNRFYFEEEITRLEKSRQFPVSIFMIDIDGLKNVNDTKGHAAGDELLKQTANLLRASFRVEDVVARIGGDEFAVLLPRTSRQTAQRTLRRLRKNLGVHDQKYPDFPLKLSLGVATTRYHQSLLDVLMEADRRMYQEKISK
jgi:diguanylate cyclase (GGDEF)-like protein/PAS domain S-box-containing protein